jgi:hypothetical protein
VPPSRSPVGASDMDANVQEANGNVKNSNVYFL